MQVSQAHWSEVVSEAKGCHRCPLWKSANGTVFGEGPVPADAMLVGEQPGDQEDRQGRPFVGPAGQVLRRALDDAGIDRDEIYVTNVVKHFKWEARGKRRIHQRPDRREVEACRVWFDNEVELVRPRLIVFLGATAAQSQFGSSFRVSHQRGVPLPCDLAEFVVATAHPSSVLRAPSEDRRSAHDALVADLRAAFGLLAA